MAEKKTDGNTSDWQRKFAEARLVPASLVAVTLLDEFKLWNGGRSGNGSCPSDPALAEGLYVYRDGMKWGCAACGTGGDGIALVRHLRPTWTMTTVLDWLIALRRSA